MENIKVEYLCNQPFWTFKKSGKENFCRVCKHNIHDLTNMDSEEIKLIVKNIGGNTCGSFYKEQLEINEQTQHSPALYKLIYAGVITFLSTVFSSQGQENINVHAKTEQHYTTRELNEIYPVCLPEESPDSLYNDDEETVIHKRKKRRRGLKLFSIGRRSVYLTARFPFFRSYWRFMGRIKF